MIYIKKIQTFIDIYNHNMPLYENSVIYKLVHCNDQDNENIYIGSTTNFRGRKRDHKSRCYNSKDRLHNINVYCFIRENGGWEECLMIPIEVYPCNNKYELKVRERYYIELMKPKLNKQIPTRTDKEYREDNKERIKEYTKQFYEKNKEHIKEQRKEKLFVIVVVQLEKTTYQDIKKLKNIFK